MLAYSYISTLLYLYAVLTVRLSMHLSERDRLLDTRPRKATHVDAYPS